MTTSKGVIDRRALSSAVVSSSRLRFLPLQMLALWIAQLTLGFSVPSIRTPFSSPTRVPTPRLQGNLNDEETRREIVRAQDLRCKAPASERGALSNPVLAGRSVVKDFLQGQRAAWRDDCDQ